MEIQEALFPILGIAFMVLALAFVLGWLIPLIIGIVSLKRGARTLGLILTIGGSVWGFAAIAGVAFMVFTLSHTIRSFEAEDFDPSEYEGRMGRLVAPWDGDVELVVSSNNDDARWRLSFSDGIAQSPAKDWNIDSFSVHTETADNGTWTLTGSYRAVERTINVEPDADTQLDFGPPLTAKLNVRSTRSDGILVSLKILDSAGGDCQLYQDPDEPVRFVALSESGEKLWEEAIEHG